MPGLTSLDLTTINLGLNGLSDLPNLPTTIVTVTADNNNLTSIPSTIRLSSWLHYLNLDNNDLTSLPSGICTHLNILKLAGNEICPVTEFQSGGSYYSCDSISDLSGENLQNCGE